MPYPTKNFLYETKQFICKSNLKAGLTGGEDDPIQYLALSYVKSFCNCLDIGARFGEWRILGQLFQNLYAFEPRKKWRYLYELNVQMENVNLYSCGLGSQNETVWMLGNRIVDAETIRIFSKMHPNARRQPEKIEVKRLDDFRFSKVDFIKIDTDGYELQVLKGGIKTISKWKPIICMEVLSGEPYYGEVAEKYLLDLGARYLDGDQQNRIYGW